MKLTFFCRLFMLILVFKISVQMDLLTPYQKRYSELLKHIGPLFNREKLKNILTTMERPVSFECYIDLLKLCAEENYNESAQFFDAWSSLPVGLLYEQKHSFGNFDECRAARIKSNIPNKPIKGKNTQLHAFILPNKNFSVGLDLFTFDICLPDTCEQIDVDLIFTNNFNTTSKFFGLFGKFFNENAIESHEISFRVSDNENSISEKDHLAAKIGVIFFSFILTLVMLSSLYEFILTRTNGKPHPLLKSFSILTNSKQLFQMRTKNCVSPNIIECIDGIRSLTLIWNIFGHTYMWSMSRSDSNGPHRIEALKEIFSRVLTAANLSVDAFLLLSGLLVAWIGLNRMSRANGKINIKLMYLHRYLRLTPSYAATVLFASGLYVFMGSGPFWHQYVLRLTKNCQKYWWCSLFYITNYYNIENQCIGHSWFLAVDTQLYIISPFILKGLWKWPRKMIGILIFLIVFSRYCVYSAVLHIGQRGFVFDNMLTVASYEYDRVQYRTEMRMASWLIGILLGYCLFQYRNKSLKLSRITVLLGWLVTLLVMTLIVLGPQRLYEHHIEPSPLESALYESLGRCCWVIGLAWIIFSCYMGYSESINSFLSHEIWQLIAKLNYTIYLVKTFININNLALQKTPANFSHYDMMAEFWADFGISATFAVILSLSVELPFIAIQKSFEKTSWIRLI